MVDDLLTDVLRLALWLAVLAAIFGPLEWLAGARPPGRRRHQTAVDLAWYFINSLVPAAIIALPLAGLARALDGLDPGGFHSWVAAFPIGAKLVAALFVNDLGAYWVHRWQHKSPLLWRFHAVHHSATELDWLVNTRAHPIDLVLTRLGGLVPVYLLGLGSPTSAGDPLVLWVAIIGTLWSFFLHANLRWRLSWIERLISTPAFHHWHHSNDEHRDRNFAAVFPMIDRLFGTHHLPSHLPSVYGIDAEIAPTLAGQLIHPFARRA